MGYREDPCLTLSSETKKYMEFMNRITQCQGMAMTNNIIQKKYGDFVTLDRINFKFTYLTKIIIKSRYENKLQNNL